MNTVPTPQTDMLYEQGVEAFRDARWQDAVTRFSELKAISSAYPEADFLISEAMLKLEIERADEPEAIVAPRQRIPIVPIVVALMLLAIIGGGGALFFAMPRQQEAVAPPAPTIDPASIRPTLAPTNTPTATPVVTAEQGTLTVRMADGQSLTRTINNIAFVLDASGSMLAQAGNVRKIDIAHESMEMLVRQLSDTTNVALLTYGRRSTECTDSELVTPLAPLNRDQFIGQINGVVPVPNARTPMALALQQIGTNLKDVQSDTLIVLVSDGDETCDGDPVAAAKQLHTTNPNLRVSVIGFDVGPEEWRARLSGIAEQGGGTYFNAADATQLAAALEAAVKLSYHVRDVNGAEITQGDLGSSVTLKPGRYHVTVGEGDGSLVQTIEVPSNGNLALELSEKGGQLLAQVVK